MKIPITIQGGCLLLLTGMAPLKEHKKVAPHGNSVDVVICNQATCSLLYWPDLYSDAGRTTVTSLLSSDGSSSLTASAIPNMEHSCKRQK